MMRLRRRAGLYHPVYALKGQGFSNRKEKPAEPMAPEVRLLILPQRVWRWRAEGAGACNANPTG